MKPKVIEEDAKSYLDRLFKIKPDFKRFQQKYDIFNRAVWDKKVNPKNFFVSYDITNFAPKKAKGFDHWDYAFRNASWHLTDVIGEMKFEEQDRVEGFTDYYSIQTQGPPSPAELKSPEDTTQRIKQAADMFGAGAVGICEIDPRWIYSSTFKRQAEDSPQMDLPESYKYAIMLIIPMDYKLSKTYPAALSGAATGIGYSVGLNAANTLAQFIKNLGYEATASLNDTALNIPMSIQAGLGEYGRHGLLITPKFGPNIRIAKVFTDLPLIPDKPVEFGVNKFCQICEKCASACPVKAIPKGKPQSKAPNISSLEGISKWTVNAEKCFKFWVGMNTDCAICIRVCPYNKDYSKWWNRIGISLANSPLRKFMLYLDDLVGFGKRQLPEEWWRKGGGKVEER